MIDGIREFRLDYLRQLENMAWTLDWTGLDWTLDGTGLGVNFLESVSLQIVTRGQHSSIWLHFSLI